MADIFEYFRWRGDLTLESAAFNEVDAVILARFSYLPFGLVEPGKIGEVCDRLLACPDIGEKMLLEEDLHLAQVLSESQRYRDMEVCGFAERLDEDSQTQFAAVMVKLKKGLSYVAFRGTDNTLVGWKEDFNMCFGPVRSQKLAEEYLDEIGKDLPGQIIVGGHSKGGNLAVYAAAFVGEDVQERILNVFNNDGPGHDLATLQSAGYQRVENRIRTFIPKSSIIGMLLEHGDAYRIVDSDAHGLWQHNPYSWQLRGGDFAYLQHTTAASDCMNESIRQWLNQMDTEKRRRFADTVYDVLSASEVRSVGQLIHDFRGSLPPILAATRNLDPEERRMLAELAVQFVRVASVQYGQLAREQVDTARAYMSVLREKKEELSAWLEKLREEKGE